MKLLTTLLACLPLSLPILAPAAPAGAATMMEEYAAANASLEAGDLDAGATHMAQALAIAQRELAPQDLQIGVLAFNLGQIQAGRGQYGEAREALEIAVSSYEAAHGKSAEQLLAPLNALAVCFDRLGEPKEAFEVRQRILKVTEKVSGKESIKVAEALQPLAQYAGQNQKFAKAERYLKQARRIWKKQRGKDSREYATVTFYMGLNDLGLGEYLRGMDRIEQAVATLEQVVPDGDPDKIQMYETLRQIGKQLAGLPFPTPDIFEIDVNDEKLAKNRAIAARAETEPPPVSAAAQ